MSRKISKDRLSPRAIDALVAEHVMGYETDSYKDNFKSNVGWFSIDDWRPSTDIAAAWEVVEKLSSENCFHSLCVYYLSSEDNGLDKVYLMDFDYCHSDADAHEAEADTAPMAICLAALKAKGITSWD